MRVIEPLPRRPKPKKKSSTIIFALTAFIIVILGGFLFITRRAQHNQSTLGTSAQNSDAQSAQTTKDMKYLSAYDFQKLYDQTAYPNTRELDQVPKITGDIEADSRIRRITESRGYKLQPVPAQSIIKVADIQDSDANLLQPLAHEGWLKMQEQATADKIPLKVKFGYRSIDKQRELFLQKLNAEGASADKIAKGEVDDKVINALLAVSPPGYSRHQTGYAIDLICDVAGSSAFEISKCATWLKDNNYAKAKQAGYIPSRVEKIGPPNSDPLTAEYVWVGTQAFY